MGKRFLLLGTAMILLATKSRADTAPEVERSVRTIQAAFNRGDVQRLVSHADEIRLGTHARYRDGRSFGTEDCRGFACRVGRSDQPGRSQQSAEWSLQEDRAPRKKDVQ